MKIKSLIFAALLPLVALCACEDETSPIGNSLVADQVSITVDTLELKLNASSVFEDNFDSRTQTKMLGRINVPEYGSLNCSFITQLLSVSKLNVPDSIKSKFLEHLKDPSKDNPVDSMRMLVVVPRGSLTGDSLAPQQLTAYGLKDKIPSDINSTTNLSGLYDNSTKLGSKSYTLSALAMNDSLFQLQNYITIPVMMPDRLTQKVFKDYCNNPEWFAWPSYIDHYPDFKGVYVEQNFGNGCVGLVSTVRFYTYWHYMAQVYQKKDDDSDEYEYVPTLTRDSVCLFASQPEVLSANHIKYEKSDYLQNLADNGKAIITTPGGYHVDITFPAQDIINNYEGQLQSMAVISKLTFEIPAEAIENEYGLDVAPHLLMVKESEREAFFRENKVPDGKTSFYAPYNSTTKSYTFSGMRDYIMELIAKGGSSLTEADTKFSLVPVIVSTEDVSSYSSSATYVTRCAQYIGRPTMTELDTDHAIICFTFTQQTLK